jgi:hypothetical protein
VAFGCPLSGERPILSEPAREAHARASLRASGNATVR